MISLVITRTESRLLKIVVVLITAEDNPCKPLVPNLPSHIQSSTHFLKATYLQSYNKIFPNTPLHFRTGFFPPIDRKSAQYPQHYHPAFRKTHFRWYLLVGCWTGTAMDRELRNKVANNLLYSDGTSTLLPWPSQI